MSEKILFILHRSPPFHGAAKVGDFIAESKRVNEQFTCKFVTIKSSDTISDIGKVSFRKISLFSILCLQVLWAMIMFRPHKIYFTASIKGVAFYRDYVLSIIWKAFGCKNVFYHYHTTGINDFVSASDHNLTQTNKFVKNVNLVLLSPLLANDLKKISGYKQIFHLPNGAKDNLTDVYFENIMSQKFSNDTQINVLFVSNMIKSKGYLDVLNLAKATKAEPIIYHFAGSWALKQDELEFFQYVKSNNLENSVIFHGFVKGKKKQSLFEKAHIFIHPTQNDTFPLTILEALSYGIPTISTQVGGIPDILSRKTGYIVQSIDGLHEALKHTMSHHLTKDTAIECRERYLNNFTLTQFEDNLIEILKHH
ncbi:MAG: glycosyltransferase family 4 protein [Alphaproteobacteria bacterium]|nr:glycosyltransferase family 4 protein [Alphaproteobacteria bacterium]